MEDPGLLDKRSCKTGSVVDQGDEYKRTTDEVLVLKVL